MVVIRPSKFFSLGDSVLGKAFSHIIGNFVFADYPLIIPNGIEITLTTNSPDSAIIDNEIALCYNNSGITTIGTDAIGTAWSSLTTRVYGSNTALWGSALSAAQWQSIINDDQLCVSVKAYNSDGDTNKDAQLDAAKLKVYYNTTIGHTISTLVDNGY